MEVWYIHVTNIVYANLDLNATAMFYENLSH